MGRQYIGHAFELAHCTPVAQRRRDGDSDRDADRREHTDSKRGQLPLHQRRPFSVDVAAVDGSDHDDVVVYAFAEWLTKRRGDGYSVGICAEHVVAYAYEHPCRERVGYIVAASQCRQHIAVVEPHDHSLCDGDDFVNSCCTHNEWSEHPERSDVELRSGINERECNSSQVSGVADGHAVRIADA